ncbi:MAG: aspartate/glutamate racemase family protein [Bacillota bacterium]
MRIKVVIPNVGMARSTLDQREAMLKTFARRDTVISVDCITHGPESIEGEYDEVLAAPEIVDRAVAAEREGYDAFIIYCSSDPALAAAREMVSIPVIGPGEASILTAMALGQRLSIVTVLEETVPGNQRYYHRLGFPEWRLASVRSLGIPVSRLRDNLAPTSAALLATGRRCRDEDGAHVIVLACLGMAGLGARLQKELGLPVVDPAFTSVAWAEALVATGLAHSRVAYPKPPDKLRV